MGYLGYGKGCERAEKSLKSPILTKSAAAITAVLVFSENHPRTFKEVRITGSLKELKSKVELYFIKWLKAIFLLSD